MVLNCCYLLLLGTLIATWRERGCNSFWKVIKQFPFLRSHIVGWKACFVIHRVFRDGHPDVSCFEGGTEFYQRPGCHSGVVSEGGVLGVSILKIPL